MKTAGLRSAVLLVMMLIAATGVRTDSTTTYFDDYGIIPWNEEKIRLDNFAVFLQQNAGYTGYIGYRIGVSDSPPRVKTYIESQELFDQGSKDRVGAARDRGCRKA